VHPEDDGSPSRVFIVTFLSHFSTIACASFRSNVASGAQVIYLGLEDNLHGSGSSRGFGYLSNHNMKSLKVHVVLKFLEHATATGMIRNQDLIVFSDGTDTLYTLKAKNKVAERFFAMDLNPKNTVLFSAERGCYPNYCIFDSTINSTYKYPNSGQWIARKDVAVWLLRSWLQVMKTECFDADDQLAIHEMRRGYVIDACENMRVEMKEIDALVQKKYPNEAHRGVLVAIDTNCKIFQSMYGRPVANSTESHKVASGPYFSKSQVLKNSETKTEPLFAHFNGDVKPRLIEAELAYFMHYINSSSSSNYTNACADYIRDYPSSKSCFNGKICSTAIKV